jgi:membrane protease YdiL (CAAX protease family)
MMLPRSLVLRPIQFRAAWPATWRALPRVSVGVYWAAYLGALLGAEFLVNLWWLRSAILAETVILAALLVHGSTGPVAERRFLVALALAPMIRLVSLSLPLGVLTATGGWALTGGTLFVAAFTAIRVLELTRGELALRLGVPRTQLIIGLLGFPIGTLSYMVLRPLPLLPSLDWQVVAVPAAVLLVCGGFLEELIFRGILQTTAYDVLGWWGVAFVALVSTALSLGFLSAEYSALVLVVSLLFGWIVVRTGSLLGVSLAHGIACVMLFLVVPLL